MTAGIGASITETVLIQELVSDRKSLEKPISGLGALHDLFVKMAQQQNVFAKHLLFYLNMIFPCPLRTQTIAPPISP